MKKLLMTIMAISMVSIANAKIYKIQDYTPAQIKQIEKTLEEGSGDYTPIATDKGLLWMYVESQAAKVLYPSKKGLCFNVTGEFAEMTAKQVKCPKNLNSSKK